MTIAVWGIAAGMAWMFGFAWYRRGHWADARLRP